MSGYMWPEPQFVRWVQATGVCVYVCAHLCSWWWVGSADVDPAVSLFLVDGGLIIDVSISCVSLRHRRCFGGRWILGRPV